MQYIDAVIDNKSVNTDNFYTYKAPDEVEVGAKLTVPFARRSKSVDAYCVRVGVESGLDDSKIKEIDTFDPGRSLSSEMVGTAMWMRKRYGIKYIDGLKMFAVDGKREKALKTKTSGPSDPDYELTDEQKTAADRICASVEKRETKTYLIPFGSQLKVVDGQEIEAGDELTEGPLNPHDILKIKGVEAVQNYILREVQKVYSLQGVEINDKHIEIIVRQMLKKTRIEESGDSEYLPGTLADVLEVDEMNEIFEAEDMRPIVSSRILLGITKASLATNSFLSAASFQETTKVLTGAAIKGKIDPLIGLKENVLIGKLIPAGTGMKRYRQVKLDTDYSRDIDADDEDIETMLVSDEILKAADDAVADEIDSSEEE